MSINHKNSVTYTAITGGKDSLKDVSDLEGNFIAYVDDLTQDSNGWELREVEDIYPDPNRNAKQYKLLPHVFLSEYDYWLWIDGTITPRVPIALIIGTYLAENDWAVFPHQLRDCAYDEAIVCGSTGRDDPEVIAKQMARYYVREGYPRNQGLAENTIILRRNTPEVIQVNELWWEEVQNGSRRDQLSFNYCCWKLGFDYKEMEGSVYDNEHFTWSRHNW